ncbi:MAG: hypothetical protein ACTSX7_06225 [Alphaproteobacteria bacterium]
MDQPNDSFDWPRLSWPVNEILLQTLVLEGMKDNEIADTYRVPVQAVTERRETFGL